LFILDDLGLEPFDAPGRLSLLEILEDRLGRRSMIIVSQVPISTWHDLIGEPNTTECHTTRSVGTRYDHRPCQSALRAVLFCS
jgi:DNA replication protein DnaC